MLRRQKIEKKETIRGGSKLSRAEGNQNIQGKTVLPSTVSCACEHAQLLQSCLTLPPVCTKRRLQKNKEGEGRHGHTFLFLKKSGGSLVFLTTLSVGDAHCF